MEDIGGWSEGSKRPCYIHRIDLTVGSMTIRCNVAFCEDMSEEMTDQLIGREVVFDRMRFALRQRVLKIYVGNVP